MAHEIVERVKQFLTRLIKDEMFRNQLEKSSIDERNQILQDSGFAFSQSEFESALIEVLEAKENGEFEDVKEEELSAVFGGIIPGIFQPVYGVVYPPEWIERFPILQPIKPPEAIAMYGVVIAERPELS